MRGPFHRWARKRTTPPCPAEHLPTAEPNDDPPAEALDEDVQTALRSYVGLPCDATAFCLGWVITSVVEEHRVDGGALTPRTVLGYALDVARPDLTLEQEIAAEQLISDLFEEWADDGDS